MALHHFPRKGIMHLQVRDKLVGIRKIGWMIMLVNIPVLALKLWEIIKILKDKDKSTKASFKKQSKLTRQYYKLRLTTSTACSRFFLHQQLPFGGHHESNESENIGNFPELAKLAATLNETIAAVVLENAPGNQSMKSHSHSKRHCQFHSKRNTGCHY